jgi:hypothetical protein
MVRIAMLLAAVIALSVVYPAAPAISQPGARADGPQATWVGRDFNSISSPGAPAPARITAPLPHDLGPPASPETDSFSSAGHGLGLAQADDAPAADDGQSRAEDAPSAPVATRPQASVAPAPARAPADESTNSAQTMINDATLPHEDCLDSSYVHGFSWQFVPDAAWWNPSPIDGYGALTGWFAITTDAWPTCSTQPPAANVRVEVRSFRTYAFANGAWRLVQDQSSAGLGSLLFLPNFQPGEGHPDVRDEPDGGQSWLPGTAALWHGWPGPRAAIPPGTAYVCTQYQARLVLDDPAGPDNRAVARMLADAGFDWWESTVSGGNKLGMNGRYKLIPQDGSYRWFNGCSAPAAMLLASPPPFE